MSERRFVRGPALREIARRILAFRLDPLDMARRPARYVSRLATFLAAATMVHMVVILPWPQSRAKERELEAQKREELAKLQQEAEELTTDLSKIMLEMMNTPPPPSKLLEQEKELEVKKEEPKPEEPKPEEKEPEEKKPEEKKPEEKKPEEKEPEEKKPEEKKPADPAPVAKAPAPVTEPVAPPPPPPPPPAPKPPEPKPEPKPEDLALAREMELRIRTQTEPPPPPPPPAPKPTPPPPEPPKPAPPPPAPEPEPLPEPPAPEAPKPEPPPPTPPAPEPKPTPPPPAPEPPKPEPPKPTPPKPAPEPKPTPPPPAPEPPKPEPPKPAPPPPPKPAPGPQVAKPEPKPTPPAPKPQPQTPPAPKPQPQTPPAPKPQPPAPPAPRPAAPQPKPAAPKPAQPARAPGAGSAPAAPPQPIPTPPEVGSETAAARDARVLGSMRAIDDYGSFARSPIQASEGEVPAILFTNRGEHEWLELISYFGCLPIAYSAADPSYYIAVDVFRGGLTKSTDTQYFAQHQYAEKQAITMRPRGIPRFESLAREVVRSFGIPADQLVIAVVAPKKVMAYLTWKVLKECQERGVRPRDVRACYGRFVHQADGGWAWIMEQMVRTDGTTIGGT